MKLKKLNNIIIGAGEIGKSIGEVIPDRVYYKDLKFEDSIPMNGVNILHICIPYNEIFVDEVDKYIYKYDPYCIIIHSTIKPGTSKKITFDNVVYSPVRGRHKTLPEHIKKFVKYYYSDSDSANLIFENIFHNLKIEKATDYESLETAKIFSTTYMYWNIVFQRYLRSYCADNNIDFDFIYSEWNSTYNEMCNDDIYSADFKRPIYEFIPGNIGGHCLNENLPLIDCKIMDIINDFKKDYKYE